MKLAPITIIEEIANEHSELNILVEAQLDLDSGDIKPQKYWVLDEDGNKVSEYNVKLQKLPSAHPNYAFSSGTLRINTLEVEFAVEVDKKTGKYEVNVDELDELKTKAQELFLKQTKKSKP